MNNRSIIYTGNRVKVTLVGKKWGDAVVKDISTKEYGGSLLFPVFLVRNDQGEELWVPPISIEKIEE